MVKRKFRKFPKPTKGLTRDVKQALKIGKKILNKKKRTNKFKVPNVKLVRNYGKTTPGIT